MGKVITLGECVALAGNDAAAGVLLYVAQHWVKVAAKATSNTGWAIHTREEWMGHTGLTRHTYDRALRKLKLLDLVEVRHGPHKYRSQTFKSTWIRLPWGIAEIGLSANTDNPLSAKQDKQLSANTDNQLSANTDHLLYSNLEYVKNKRYAAAGETIMDTKKTVQEITAGKKALGFEGVKSMEMLDPPAMQVETAGDLYELWKYAHSTAYPGVTKTSWTKASTAFAKTIIDKLGKDAGPALDAAVRDWGGFIDWMQANTSVKSIPEKPDLFFLMKFTEGLLNYYEQSYPQKEYALKPAENKAYAKGVKVLG